MIKSAKINKSNGTINIERDVNIGPKTKIKSIIKSNIKTKIRWKKKDRKSYSTELIRIEGKKFKLKLYFEVGKLVEVQLIMKESSYESDSWEDWSKEKELERKEAHDMWLEAVFGDPPYTFEWGTVRSEYDTRGATSKIIFDYK